MENLIYPMISRKIVLTIDINYIYIYILTIDTPSYVGYVGIMYATKMKANLCLRPDLDLTDLTKSCGLDNYSLQNWHEAFAGSIWIYSCIYIYIYKIV